MPFLDSLDIANRAMQHVGAARINAIDEDSRNNTEAAFAYDKLLEAELRRNVWRFAIRNVVLRPVDENALVLNPQRWRDDITYHRGSVVADENGLVWWSTVPANLGNQPGRSTVWEAFFGPSTASLHISTESYMAGEVVYKEAGSAGGYVVFQSMQNGNADDPLVATPWDVDATYRKDDRVSSGGLNWRSLIEVNKGITPADAPATWDPDAVYSVGQKATGRDGFIYESTTNGNQGNEPLSSGDWLALGVAAAWSQVPEQFPASNKWLPLFVGLRQPNLIYPIGAGPIVARNMRGVYRLPFNFLREAPQDPKAGQQSFLGAPTGLPYSDWRYQGYYFTSADPGPIVFRFVAHITNVTQMDPMFCEGLACRVAYAVCESLTQSTSKLSAIGASYTQWMNEARTVNGIETGPTEPPEDEFLTVRL